MTKKLEFKFDPNEDFQLDAIRSVVGVFEGLARHTSEFALGDDVVPNLPRWERLSEGWLYDNVAAVQEGKRKQGRRMTCVE